MTHKNEFLRSANIANILFCSSALSSPVDVVHESRDTFNLSAKAVKPASVFGNFHIASLVFFAKHYPHRNNFSMNLFDKSEIFGHGGATHINGATPASRASKTWRERGFLVCVSVRPAGIPRGPGRSVEREYWSGFFYCPLLKTLNSKEVPQ
jgi:hypothetical protein